MSIQQNNNGKFTLEAYELPSYGFLSRFMILDVYLLLWSRPYVRSESILFPP